MPIHDWCAAVDAPGRVPCHADGVEDVEPPAIDRSRRNVYAPCMRFLTLFVDCSMTEDRVTEEENVELGTEERVALLPRHEARRREDDRLPVVAAAVQREVATLLVGQGEVRSRTAGVNEARIASIARRKSRS